MFQRATDFQRYVNGLLHEHQARSWESLRQQVLFRAGYVCEYCRPSADEVDHVVPVAVGGPVLASNLVACCGSCNKQAGCRYLGDFDAKWLTLYAERHRPIP